MTKNHSWELNDDSLVVCEHCGLLLKPNTKRISRDGKTWRTVKQFPKCKNSDEEVCPDCDGKGYDVFCASHTANLRTEEHPVDLPEIQRCDSCRIFPGDDEAQEQFLKDVVAGKVKLPRYLLLWGEKE